MAKSCPFCGSAALEHMIRDYTEHYIRCETCGARGPVVEVERASDDDLGGKLAVAAWDRRADRRETA